MAKVWLASLAVLPAPMRPDVDNRGGYGIEDAGDLVEDILIAPDHDRQGAVNRFRFAAADRGIEHRHTLLGQRLIDLLRRERSDRTHVDEDQARSSGLNDPVSASATSIT
jgi:hypothetical protein